MELIPGLPNHVALECLIRVPFHQFAAAVSVCKGWKAEIELPEFRKYRKATGFSRSLVVMAQARFDPMPNQHGVKSSASPAYRLTLCEPETGSWWELPAVPGLAYGLPVFCQLAGVGPDLVVMGGCDPVTWEVSQSVFIYNLISATWRRGADMPGSKRSFFACASDGDRRVFVAGGHDDEKNALRSAMAYDVAEDKWIPLSDMSVERDECKGVFYGGKFHAVGGYRTEMQGRFERSAEAFDVASWKWGQVREDLFDAAMCPRNCVDGGDGSLHICHEGKVMALDCATWQVRCGLPADVCTAAYVCAWRGKLLVIGCAKYGEPHRACYMDLKTHKWTKVVTPEDYSGHVQSGCCLEI